MLKRPKSVKFVYKTDTTQKHMLKINLILSEPMVFITFHSNMFNSFVFKESFSSEVKIKDYMGTYGIFI